MREGSDPANTSASPGGYASKPPREVRLCVGSSPPTRTAGRSRIRRSANPQPGALAQLLDSEFWTIERLTALVGVVFLLLNFCVLTYWLPHPHVHLPHLHMPHLPKMPRRRPRLPGGTAAGVQLAPADAAAAAATAMDAGAWRANDSGRAAAPGSAGSLGVRAVADGLSPTVLGGAELDRRGLAAAELEAKARVLGEGDGGGGRAPAAVEPETRAPEAGGQGGGEGRAPATAPR